MSRSVSKNPSRGVWLKRSLLGLAALLAIGAGYQQIAQNRDLRRHPAPGDLVDIGETRLHLHCVGDGTPTVVAEAGADAFSLVWRSVQREVAEETRMCSYDREGFGWSDFSGVIPTPERVSTNLRAALNTAGIEGPYVVVGHSLGGVYVRDFTARYPDDVVGMVLVDSSHENQILHMPEEMRSQQDRFGSLFRGLARICSSLQAVGALRVTGFWSLTAEMFPEDVRATYVMARNRTRYCSVIRNDLLLLRDMGQQESQTLRSLGDLPLVVLSHGVSQAETPVEKEFAAAWSVLQAELAALSSESDHRVVGDAGHNIHVERPDVVIDAILEVVAASTN